MQTIDIRSLRIAPDRQRQEFNPAALEDLITSIEANGIIHPPAVSHDKETNFPTLVAGERRVRAMQSLIEMGKLIRCGNATCPENHIPVLDLGALTDAQSFEAELAENIDRENLTWQERAKAESRLHEFRGKQAQERGETQSLSATATEIIQRTIPEGQAVGYALTEVATRINLARHLDDPDVAAARTQKDAVKVVRAKQQARENAVAARNFDEHAAHTVPHTLLEGSMLDILPRLEESTFDVLLTDPPYGIDADSFGEQAGAGHNYEDSHDYFRELLQVLASESYRVCRPEAHAYVFCDPRRFDEISLQFELAGWDVWPIPLIWAKGNGMLPRPHHAPRRTYESILFASKGGKMVKCVKADVISVSAVRVLQHGAQKPVDLYVELLSRSAAPGDTVLDCFAGSGTIFPAANRAKVVAVGIELVSANINICKTRMANTEDLNDLPPF